MEPKDRKRLAACLMAASELYAREVSPAVSEVWARSLEPYDIGAIEGAFSRHFVSPDSGQYMPKPADIVKMLEGSSEDGALVAWAKVDKAVRQVGAYRTVVFDDALIHRVLHDMGGWIGFGMKREEDWPFVANEFVKRYRGYRLRREAADYPARLIGIHEAENHMAEAPVLIGNPAKADAVLKGGSNAPLIGIHRAGAVLKLLPSKGKA